TVEQALRDFRNGQTFDGTRRTFMTDFPAHGSTLLSDADQDQAHASFFEFILEPAVNAPGQLFTAFDVHADKTRMFGYPCVDAAHQFLFRENLLVLGFGLLVAETKGVKYFAALAVFKADPHEFRIAHRYARLRERHHN